MREKLRNKKGFTLAELLIVVAIIAVLVAIMLPVFGASRAKAILARDAANLRSIYSELVVDAMTEGEFDNNGKITILLGDALSASSVEFDSKTSAKFAPAGSGKENATITVSYPGVDDDEIIVIDKDVILKKSTGSTYTSSNNKILPLS